MRYLHLIRLTALVLVGLGLISAAWAQNPDVVITYGSTTNVTNGSLYGEVTIGQTLVGSSSGSNNAIAHGLWGLYLREPLPIQVNASQGDYPDQIVVEWNLDGLSAVADAEIAYKLYRNNALVAELSADQRRFVDTNVLAGIFYTYEVEGINEFGTSQRGAAVGFVNPNGVITGNISTTRGTPMADVEVSVLPNLGQALQFDGIDDYAQIPADTLMNTESFTLEFWFRAAANRAQGMFRKGFRVMMNDANGVIEFDTPGNIGNLTSNPTTIGEWNHVAVTFDAASQTAKLYLNAALQDSATGITSMNGASGEALKIGTDGSSYFQGNIDDVRLWNVARSQADIARHKGRTVETFEVDNGLVGYWKFDEGILDYVFDLTEHDLDGRTYGPTWTNQKADVRTSAFTDLHGNYIIEGVNYGNGTTFTVTPRKIIVIDDTTTFEHSYNPNFRYVTLNPSNTARDQIDFNDISLVPVSGFVRYAAHPDCPVDSAEILQDGDIFRPQVFTEEDGSFLVELIPGTSPRLTVRKDDHRITLENGALFFQPQNITQPIANVLFLDQTRRSITVDVVGGQCNQALTPIPGTEEEFTVTVNSIPSCLSRQLVVDGTRITFENLPPLNYEVTVQHPDPVVTFEGRQISVVDTNKSMEFRFRNDPVVDLQIMGANEACSNLTGPQGESLDPALILIQDKEYLMNIRVYEDYSRWGGGQCNIDSGSVTLSGQFFGTADTTMTFDNGGLFGLTFSPGPPNILSGGAHPYQKSLSVIARDDLDRSAADEEWVYIAGHRPRSQTFTTVTPELPLYILRDPPGDLSYSYLSEGMSLTTSTTLSTQTSSSIEDQLQIKLGADFSVSTGVGVETEIEFETELNETITANMTNTITNSSTWTQTMTMTETFNTADDGNAPGPNSDLYIGGARNMLYGLTDVLSYNDTTCTLVADTTLMMVPGSFATFYIYTDAQIKGYIIPPLESFVAYYQSIGEEDSAAYYQNQIDVWRQVLDLNHELKQTAVRDPLRPNVSFDAMSGAYQSEIETSISESRSISYDIQIEESVAMELGFEVEGIGESFSMTVTSTVGETTDESIETEYTTTVGYVLDDDDPGDFFSVDILKDPVYGTPVFKLRAGNSSCPWEQAYTHTTLEGEELVTPGTLPREGLSISVSPSSIVGLQPTEPAEFTITLGNTSESGELMRYNLEEWIPSNPYGAVMRINGSPIQDMVFTMNAGEQIDLTLTVEPGPTESIYHDMQLRFFSECEEEVAGALNIPNPIQDFATFSVEWIDPCTPVVLDEPQGSFFITPDDNNQLNVTITGYNTDEPNFRALRLQYRPRVVIGNSIIRSNREESGLRTGEWILATEPIPKDSLHFDYVIVPWDVSLLDDGEYEIRVVSECTGDDPSGVSGIVPGTIQRRPPGLLGEPEPVDGVLSENDQIILSFDEPINCQAIDPLFDLELIDMTNGGNVVYEWSCNDNQIIFTIPFDYNRFYENHTLRAKAKNIEDTYFNRMAPADSIMWEFLVDRNRIRWTNTLADVIKWEDETTSFTRQLINNGGATMEFELVDVPNWLTPSHYDGILAPGNSLTITFTINDQIGGGHYNHQVKARTDFGDEPLDIDLRVLCREPDWVVDGSQFEYSMNIIAELEIDGEISRDRYDMVAAYIGDEVRGVAPLQYVPDADAYLAFLTVYGNEVSGETVTFRAWYSLNCLELGEVEQTYPFVPNAIYGFPDNPETLTATTQITQTKELNAGWTWFSFNVLPPNTALSDVLASLTPQTGDLIKGQTQYSQFVDGFGWVGNLTQINASTSYQIKLAQADTLEMTGYPINLVAEAIPVQAGWNWIGFQPPYSLPVNAALASLNPQSGDVVKSQFAFAVYTPGWGWVGSLVFMNPREGYLLKTSNNATLTYPQEQTPTRIDPQDNPIVNALRTAQLPDEWVFYPSDYPASMTLTGVMSDDIQALAAFVDGELRGTAIPLPVGDQTRFFMMIYGDVTESAQVTFQAWDGEQIIDLAETVDFSADANLGSIEEPFTWSKGSNPEIQIPESYVLNQNYPNPFNPLTTITFGLPVETTVKLAIYDVAGRLVRLLTNGKLDAGYHQVVWDGTDNQGQHVNSGVYFYRLSVPSTGSGSSYEEAKSMLLLK